MDFESAWERSDKIDGWLSEREARLLWEYAAAVPLAGLIVEVGAYRGRSTCLMAATGRRVLTFDPLEAGYGSENGMDVVAGDAEILAANLAEFPNVAWYRLRSSELNHFAASIDLLYIDGDHTGTAPLDDFRHLAHCLHVGSAVAFHDFLCYPAVTDAVLGLEAAGELETVAVAGSLYVGRVIRCSENLTTPAAAGNLPAATPPEPQPPAA